MQAWQLGLMIGVAVIAAMIAGAVFADRLMRRTEKTPPTQDDFRCSAARWGYLNDRRNGGQ